MGNVIDIGDFLPIAFKANQLISWAGKKGTITKINPDPKDTFGMMVTFHDGSLAFFTSTGFRKNEFGVWERLEVSRPKNFVTGWIRVTDQMPENDQQCLFYCQGCYGTSYAEIFKPDAEYLNELSPETAAKVKADLKKSRGTFREFGMNYYFDDPKLYWMPVPTPPEELT